jgi:hypothetical protein
LRRKPRTPKALRHPSPPTDSRVSLVPGSAK